MKDIVGWLGEHWVLVVIVVSILIVLSGGHSTPSGDGCGRFGC